MSAIGQPGPETANQATNYGCQQPTMFKHPVIDTIIYHKCVEVLFRGVHIRSIRLVYPVLQCASGSSLREFLALFLQFPRSMIRNGWARARNVRDSNETFRHKWTQQEIWCMYHTLLNGPCCHVNHHLPV